MGYVHDEEGPASARLADSGVHVWAIVGYARAVDGDIGRVARDYRLPEQAVRAALDYYEKHRQAIDTTLAAQAA